MDNKYFIIQKNSQVYQPEAYLNAGKGEEDFRALIKREALKEGLISGSEAIKKKPEYLFYAQKMGFSWEENSDAGFLSHDYKAELIMRLVKDYARQLVNQIGFPIYEVRGANIFDESYPVVRAYANLYGDRLFRFKSGKRKVVMSYDASYPQFNLAGKYRLSYKNLPFAHFSIADCYRHEQSGECMIFHRQRRFFMPDLHPYFKDIKEAFKWYPRIEKQLVKAAAEVGRHYQVVAEVSSWDNWIKYQDRLLAIARNLDQDILVGVLMDGKDRYWIVNVDYKIIDKLGQAREIGCIQVDMGNASRLGIKYVNQKGEQVNPVIIHAAVPGGIERFMYLMFDNFKESFPLWLYPAQIRLIPVGKDYVSFCQSLIEKNRQFPVRLEIDDRAESVAKKIRLAREDLVPFSLVIGKKEAKMIKVKELDQIIKKVIDNAQGKPFIKMDYPGQLRNRIK
ncbi:MAG TPA: aminoacyl--tRNA ligase-related protein [Candidatus Bathyarchaeia archaeon]|nr:aminoacyl--tRNA ligase-related protein [Candidatus Bathyarchaeia archaeon]